MRGEISTTTEAAGAPVARVAASKHFLPAILFAVCFGAYVSNGGFLPGNDQVGNMLFSVNLLKRHSVAISPPDAPQAFFWTIAKSGQEAVPTAIDEWTESTGAAYREGQLATTSHFYYASPTVFPEVYVNTFGVGAPLAGLPVYAVLDLFVDIEHDRFWRWHSAAVTASLLTALAALFVFLAARGFVEPVPAVLIALAFGLGSCAWPVSSQALWQHPASTFLLSLGAWLLLRSERRPLAVAWCGAALGMAVGLCTAAYLLCMDRRRRAAFVPAMQFVGAYSYSLMGWSDLWRDYDRPEQASLWRWDRPQIGYHLANFNSERAREKQVMATYLNYPGPILNVPNRNRNTAP